MSIGTIYGLSGPDGIRYVGMTSKKPSVRYAAHARDAAANVKKRHVYNWWRSLEQPPELVVLEECPVDQLTDREIWWIAKFRSEGIRLCNQTDGGQGGVPSAEIRAKISAKARERYKDPAEREKVGARHRLRFADPAERAKASATATVRFAEPEYREKMSEVCSARYEDQWQRERQRDLTRSSWERMTPEERQARCDAMREGRARAKARRLAT